MSPDPRGRDDGPGVMNESDPAETAVAPIAPPEVSARSGFANAVGKLTGVNAIVLVSSLISGPITARALGADGRGQLAAIVVILAIGPWLLDIGLGQWLSRERARGGTREDLLGAALPVVLAVSMLSILGAIPLAHAIGDGRESVVTFLEIGFFLMPLNVILFALTGLAVGESRWNLYAAIRVVANVLPVVILVVLAATASVTVASSAAAYLVSGMLGGLLVLRTVQGVRRLNFSATRTAAALRFGSRCWLNQVAGSANLRLDQVLMAPLVASRELGLYAVAVTISSVTLGLTQAVCATVFPRVAEGDPGLAARACRVTALIVALAGVMLAATTPVLVPFVFGEEFRAAVPMTQILLVASVPLAVTFVLASALVAANEPGATMRAELAALAVTLPALIIFLPGSGGRAAAVISVLAYTLRVAIQLVAARRTFSLPARSFLVATRDDLAWLLAQARLVRTRFR